MSLSVEVEEIAIQLRVEFPEWREGQSLVNALSRVRPLMAATLYADQPHDPFYVDDRVPAFRAWLAEQEATA